MRAILNRLRELPIPRWKPYDFRKALAPDLTAAAAVAFLAVPQGLAYASIARLPPAVGLYALAVPTIIGSLMRSSRHVIAGPTNALSLLVGAAVIANSVRDPVEVALTLALLVGVMQVAAGVLRLGAVVDFISTPVVLGYISGAGLLIGIGQLHNLTGTEGPGGSVWTTVSGWVTSLPAAAPLALAMSGGTVLLVLALRLLGRRIERKLPSETIAMAVALAVSLGLGLEHHGLHTIGDVAPIPRGMPMPAVPQPAGGLQGVLELLPIAVACTVLSLVESTAVARSIAARTGDRLESSTEFAGQGLANVAAAFFGGYPVSGSLSRSALNERAGAETRVAGVINGVLMIGVLFALGPLLNHTPTASLAGLLVVIAVDLVDVPRIRQVVATTWPDALAFIVTMTATWFLRLDLAIYLGVVLSVLAVLRRARLLRVSEVIITDDGRLSEVRPGDPAVDGRDPGVRILHVEGALFFGAAGELQSALDDAVADQEIRAIVLRLKRADGLDATCAGVLEAAAHRLAEHGRHLLIAGLDEEALSALIAHGAADAIGRDNLFLTRPTWLAALSDARRRALVLARATDAGDADEGHDLPRDPHLDQARLPS